MPQLWIDGQPTESHAGRTRVIHDPATLEPVDTVPESTAADVGRAVAGAVAAQARWRRMPAVERAHLLHHVAVALRDDRGTLSEILTREGGKPRIENIDEVEWCAACFDYYAEIARNAHGSSIPPVADHQVTSPSRSRWALSRVSRRSTIRCCS